MRFLLIAVLVFHFFLPAQSQNTDSLSRSVDSSSQALQDANDRFQRIQDSLYRLKLQKSIDQHGKPLDQFLAEMKEQERKEKQRLYIRIALGVAFLVVLIIGIVRLRKRK